MEIGNDTPARGHCTRADVYKRQGMVCYALPYSDARTAGRSDARAYGYMPWIDGAIPRTRAYTPDAYGYILRILTAGRHARRLSVYRAGDAINGRQCK